MKSRFITYFFVPFALLIFLITSCKKDTESVQPAVEDAQYPAPVLGMVSGKVLVPSGSSIDANSLSILSQEQESAVVNNEYSIETHVNLFSTQFVSTSSGDVVMLGYTYPGTTNYDISATSSALALVMNLPPIWPLTIEGKKKTVTEVLNHNSFMPLVEEVETSIRAGKDILDTNNIALAQKVAAVLKGVSGLRVAATQPVTILRSGRTFSFVNPGKGHRTVIGIYKEGQRVKKLVIDGVRFIPTSLTDIVAGVLGTQATVEETYSLIGDGSFNIRIRTGLSSGGPVMLEQEEALWENIFMVIVETVKANLPTVLGDKNCTAAVQLAAIDLKDRIKSSIKADMTPLQIFYVASNGALENVASLQAACPAKPAKKISFWVKKAERLLNLATKSLSYIGQTGNLIMLARDWNSSLRAIDTCFLAKGNQVSKCGDCPATVTDVDGNVYNTVSIGTQCWMKENLKTTRYRDSSAIPTGLSDSVWRKTTTGAYAIYDNDPANNTLYGKLYNWYAVADSRNLCPTGWHVPSDAEWTSLVNFLGGETEAGGKMKATTGWAPPNTDATNSSGFSGLPGGFRGDDGSFNFIGVNGDWWSSSQFSSIDASFCTLNFFVGSSDWDTYQKILGGSVRCIRD